MGKKNRFFVEGIIYQILWIFLSTILFFIIYKIMDNSFVDSVDPELPLDKFASFYFEIYNTFTRGCCYIDRDIYNTEKKVLCI